MMPFPSWGCSQGFLPSPVDFSRCFQELKTLGLHRPDWLPGVPRCRGAGRKQRVREQDAVVLRWQAKKGLFSSSVKQRGGRTPGQKQPFTEPAWSPSCWLAPANIPGDGDTRAQLSCCSASLLSPSSIPVSTTGSCISPACGVEAGVLIWAGASSQSHPTRIGSCRCSTSPWQLTSLCEFCNSTKHVRFREFLSPHRWLYEAFHNLLFTHWTRNTNECTHGGQRFLFDSAGGGSEGCYTKVNPLEAFARLGCNELCCSNSVAH